MLSHTFSSAPASCSTIVEACVADSSCASNSSVAALVTTVEDKSPSTQMFTVRFRSFPLNMAIRISKMSWGSSNTNVNSHTSTSDLDGLQAQRDSGAMDLSRTFAATQPSGAHPQPSILVSQPLAVTVTPLTSARAAEKLTTSARSAKPQVRLTYQYNHGCTGRSSRQSPVDDHQCLWLHAKSFMLARRRPS